MTTEDYKKLSDSIPKDPGVYRFYDKEETILYVGKAKNLKNRLSSYFGNKKHQTHKTRTMVKNADHIDYTIVQTETDALLLEATMIKKYQPRYNVMLKDGKTYSYICIKKERFPRVSATRQVIKDGSTYFGPYTSKYNTNIILDLIKKLFQLRTCTLNLNENAIDAGKYKVCLEYHIKNCKGPCENLESEKEYNQKIEQVKNILRGNFKPVKDYLQSEMEHYAELMKFEEAQLLKDKFQVFVNYQSKSTVVHTSITDLDAFSIASDEKHAYINYLKIINGAIINSDTVEIEKKLDEEDREILEFAIPAIREKFNSIAPEIAVPIEIDFVDPEVLITIPKRGDKRHVIELSEKNVKYFLFQKKREALNKIKRQTPAERILKTLQSDLQMDKIPFHIECFDNSNIQGTNPVASCVVFKNAKPSKRDYRKFNIKTVIGPDDFASMEEVVGRRYRRLVSEGESLPDLIIIDGGKGQLSSTVKILKELEILDKVTVIGIAKKLEEIFFPDDPIPLYINKKSESLVLIQQARNEAHRFAITFHRNQRSKNALGTELTNIEGIGIKTSEKLLKKYKSVARIKELAETEIADIVGNSAAKKIVTYFEKQAINEKVNENLKEEK
ncbi:MAG TPA: excinuclease ABC subunit C [Saprospirales bacterium]|nr:excinuclease ABC subunit C [Saprospirales bacterium]|tara:strand:+ start:2803 stop:4647 length:1845 start_codon:yes stop_codon:yes gene_type:complete